MKTFTISIILLSSLLSFHAKAASLIFSSRNDFLAAVTSATSIDFEGIIAPDQDFGGDGSMTIGGVSFIGHQDNGQLGMGIGNDQAIINGLTRLDWGSGDSLIFEVGYFDVGGHLLASLPQGVGAIGFDYFAYEDNDPDGVPSSFTFTTDDGSVFNGTSLNQPNRSFFGIVSDFAIRSVRVELTNGNGRPPIPAIDNFLLANLNTVEQPKSSIPEPSTPLLLFAALCAWGQLKQNA